MAEKKRSFIGDIAVATPFAAGIGYSVNQAYKSGVFRLDPFLAKTTAFRPAVAPGTIDLSFLKSRAEYFATKEGADVARFSWAQAARFTDPKGGALLGFSGALEKLPPAEVYSNIERMLTSGNSSLLSNMYGKFMTNVKTFEGKGKIPQLVEASGFTPGPVKANMPINKLPASIARFKKKMIKEFGLQGGSVSYYTSAGWKDKGLGMYLMDFMYQGQDIKVNLPVSRDGMLVEGLAQTSARIATPVGIFDPASGKIKSTSRSGYYLRDLDKTLSEGFTSGKYKNAFDIQRAISDVYERDIYSLESVPAIPPGKMDAGWKSYTGIRGKFKEFFVAAGEGYRKLREPEREALLATGKVFPSTSPSNLAEDIYSTVDPRQWSPTPQHVEFGRRPMQANREWRMSTDALTKYMKSDSKWSIFETQAWRQDMGAYAAPWVRTVYIDPKKHAAILEKLGMKDGEAILGSRLADLMEVTSQRFPIHMKSVIPELGNRIKAGRLPFEVGEFLGMSAEGNPVHYEKGMELTELTGGATKGRGDFFDLHYKQVYKPTLASKGFGGLKGMRKFAEPETMREALSGITKNPIFQTLDLGMTQFVSADELRKDRSKLNSQLTTSLYNMLYIRRDRDAIKRNGKLASFMRNPRTFVSHMSKGVTHEEFLKRFVNFGRTAGALNAAEFQTFAGILPAAMGEEATRRIVGDEGLANLLEGWSFGMSQSVFGGTMESTGAGKLGSVEPRLFDILRGDQFGPLGAEISADLQKRLIATNPQKAAIHDALTKTLMSIEGRATPGRGEGIGWDVATKGYTKKEFQTFIEGGGGWMKAGQRNIFVPGADVMKPFITSGETYMRGELANEYHRVALELAKEQIRAKRIGLDETANLMTEFMNNILHHQAPAGKGMGAIQSGKVLGSMFFTGLSSVRGQASKDPFTVLASESYMERMFADLGKTGMYAPEEVQGMRSRFLAGEKIGGLLGRHPFIGPYAVQPIGIQAMKGVTEPVISLPSFTTGIRLVGEKAASQIELSPMVSLAGDLDADIFSLSLVDPKLEGKLTKQFVNADNDLTRAYMEQTMRMQIIKAKAKPSPGEVDTLRQMIADSKKMRTTQEWVPKMSVELGAARRATFARLEGQRGANAAFLLNWLEQVPISGKHLSVEQTSHMETQFLAVQNAMQQRNAVQIENATQSILSAADSTTRDLLVKDIQVAEGMQDIRRISGVKSMRDVLPGVNIRQASQDIAESLSMSDSQGIEEMERMAAGRRKVSNMTLGRYLSFIEGGSKGTFSGVSRAAMTAVDYMAAAGAGVIKHKKALGLGFVGSLAIAAALSSPEDTIGPGVDLNTTGASMSPTKAAGRMRPEDMMPQERAVGRPSGPTRAFVPSVRVGAGSNPSYSINSIIRGNHINPDYSNRYSRAAGATNSNVNIRDNRDSLNKYLLADKILK